MCIRVCVLILGWSGGQTRGKTPDQSRGTLFPIESRVEWAHCVCAFRRPLVCPAARCCRWLWRTARRRAPPGRAEPAGNNNGQRQSAHRRAHASSTRNKAQRGGPSTRCFRLALAGARSGPSRPPWASARLGCRQRRSSRRPPSLRNWCIKLKSSCQGCLRRNGVAMVVVVVFVFVSGPVTT